VKIVKNNVKIVCDVKGCSNIADYRLIMDVGGYDQMCLCEKCLKEFYAEAKKNIYSEGVSGAKRTKRN